MCIVQACEENKLQNVFKQIEFAKHFSIISTWRRCSVCG